MANKAYRMTYWIPTGGGVEASRPLRASEVVALRDVVQRRRSRRVQPRVQPTKSRLARRDELVVQQADHARERRRRAARSVHGDELANEQHRVLRPVGRDVGVPAPRRVVEALVRAVEVLDIRVDCRVLERGSCPVVGEAPAGEADGLLREAGRSPDGGNAMFRMSSARLHGVSNEGYSLWAARREGWVEGRTAVSLVPRHATIPRGVEHGHAPSTELGEHVA